MTIYIEQDAQRKDSYDLNAAIEFNLHGELSTDDISDVLATVSGANDEDDWFWVLAMSDGRFAMVQGWCDYTGWD